MATNLLIIGTGGLAKECAQLARQIDPQCGRWPAIKYATNDKGLLGVDLLFGSVEFLDTDLQSSSEEFDVVIGIGNPQIRRRIGRGLSENSQLNFPNLIHPSVAVDHNLVTMGCGNIFAKGVVLTCDIRVGSFNLVNLNCTIGHDAEIGDYNVINPGCNVSGRVKIGDSCLIGTGVQIIENVAIESNVIIGAGAVVTKLIETPGVYVGVPAKLKDRS